jgi:hypothetical protein
MTLERDLRAMGAGLPDPPELGPRVRIAVQRASVRRRRRRRIAVLVLALVLLVPATALAVSPDLRNRVLETFGLRGVKVERVESLPPPPVGPDANRLQLGSRVSLQQAQRALHLRVHPPTALGAPDGIFSDQLHAGVDVSFLYEPRTVAARLGVRKRVLVSVLRGTFDEQFLGKMVAAATKVTRLRIAGGRALLISGGPPHMVVFFRRAGAFDQTHARLAGTVLLWQRGALIVRVEGALPRARLVAIARTFSTG